MGSTNVTINNLVRGYGKHKHRKVRCSYCFQKIKTYLNYGRLIPEGNDTSLLQICPHITVVLSMGLFNKEKCQQKSKLQPSSPDY